MWNLKFPSASLNGASANLDGRQALLADFLLDLELILQDLCRSLSSFVHCKLRKVVIEGMACQLPSSLQIALWLVWTDFFGGKASGLDHVFV